MPSPFPGMNPYLEQEDAWHDFHERFMPTAAEALSAQVYLRYIVKIDEHVYVHELAADARRFTGRADISVAQVAERTRPAGSVAVIEAPAHVLLPNVDLERQSYLEVRDSRSRQLVTVIELLSPSNKRIGPDREQYLRKRGELLAGPVHFVELDFLRGGDRLPMENLTECDYYALVCRVEDRPSAEIWPIDLENALPVIPIPLRSPDADARIDLQQLLHRIYDAARYGSYVYDNSPEPPLTGPRRKWAESLLPANRSN